MPASVSARISRCTARVGVCLVLGCLTAHPSSAQYCPDTATWPILSSDNIVVTEYNSWKATYVVAGTVGSQTVGRRVRRTEDSDDTVSEGIGYGMLLSAYLNDRNTFDDLWTYAKYFSDPTTELMHWRIGSTGTVLGTGPATDADEDMALALVVADNKWGGYRNDAVAVINKMMQWEVDQNAGYTLKPGNWGGAPDPDDPVVNPSYFAPGAYKVFSSYVPDSRWQQVADRAYEMIRNANAGSGGGTTGLLPDWMTVNGTAQAGWSDNYTYDAIRAPWRLAIDAAWSCSGAADSRSQLARLNSFFTPIGAAGILDGYALAGTAIGQYHNAAFVAPAAAASLLPALTSTDPPAYPKYRNAVWQETFTSSHGNYYTSSLRLLALLFMTGQMPAPGNSPLLITPDGGTVITDWDNGTLNSWSDLNTATTASSVTGAPDTVDGQYSLQVVYTIGAAPNDWGASARNFGTARDWSTQNGLEFWFYGTNSGNRIRLELLDNGASGYTAERFEYTFAEKQSGWRYFRVPWSAFSRRTDWQPDGALNDGLTLTQVWGINFAPMWQGSGTFRVDTVRVK
jgi:endo-1,4-beta-D-glucanase Y